MSLTSTAQLASSADLSATLSRALPQAQLHTHPHAAAQAQALADDVAGQLREAIAARGRAVLAVSGGKSPIPFFHALRERALDWSKVTVMLADERCVNRDHADSNSALVARELLQGRAATATWLGFFDEVPTLTPGQDDDTLTALANQAGVRVAQTLDGSAGALDVLVLGMGEDAHTASIFPGAVGTEHALATSDWVAGMWPQTAPIPAPHARLTLSGARLCAARHVHLSIAGDKKRDVLTQAMTQPGPHAPIAWVLSRASGDVHIWQA